MKIPGVSCEMMYVSILLEPSELKNKQIEQVKTSFCCCEIRSPGGQE